MMKVYYYNVAQDTNHYLETSFSYAISHRGSKIMTHQPRFVVEPMPDPNCCKHKRCITGRKSVLNGVMERNCKVKTLLEVLLKRKFKI